MSMDTMEVLVRAQRAALNPATSEQALRDILINTLEIAEKDQQIINYMGRLQDTQTDMIAQQEATIKKLSAEIRALTRGHF